LGSIWSSLHRLFERRTCAHELHRIVPAEQVQDFPRNIARADYTGRTRQEVEATQLFALEDCQVVVEVFTALLVNPKLLDLGDSRIVCLAFIAIDGRPVDER